MAKKKKIEVAENEKIIAKEPEKEVVYDESYLDKTDSNGNYLYYKCTQCGRVLPISKYFPSTSATSIQNHVRICNDCCRRMSLDKSGRWSRNKVFVLLALLDIPYSENAYNYIDANETDDNKKTEIYVLHLAKPNSPWKDKRFVDSNVIEMEDDNRDINLGINWGSAFNEDEKAELDSLFLGYVENYPLRTTMHKQLLKQICLYEYRAQVATANGDVSEAKIWNDMLSKARTDAKINPSQLSQADLSEGMSNFSQLSASVEKTNDVILLMPKYRQAPQDLVDYTIWQYVNYERALNGKPECSYSEIYDFLQRNFDKYKKDLAFLKLDENGYYDDNDLDTEVY